MEGLPAWRRRPNGLELRVRVMPRSGIDALEGMGTLSDGRGVLKVRVRAVPDAGAANRAVRDVIARCLGCPASAVSLSTGAGMRVKTILVEGDPASLETAIARLIGRGDDG